MVYPGLSTTLSQALFCRFYCIFCSFRTSCLEPVSHPDCQPLCFSTPSVWQQASVCWQDGRAAGQWQGVGHRAETGGQRDRGGCRWLVTQQHRISIFSRNTRGCSENHSDNPEDFYSNIYVIKVESKVLKCTHKSHCKEAIYSTITAPLCFPWL